VERDGVRAPEKAVILGRGFYERATIDVARDLLGKVLVHGDVAGMIVETEAYLGGDDLASHSAAGITNRTRVIFGPPGHAYVYLSYGMHDCLNIVAERDGTPGCVLIRALEPVDGIEEMRTRRPKARSDRDLASGPGKLTQAMAITRKYSGVDMTHGDLVVRSGPRTSSFAIAVTPRIGITKCADLPLRFLIRGNRFVSGGRTANERTLGDSAWRDRVEPFRRAHRQD
jgi:DNA-3-methyladenine glycosylase